MGGGAGGGREGGRREARVGTGVLQAGAGVRQGEARGGGVGRLHVWL